MELMEKNQKVCPFCQSHNEENLKKIIRIYSEIYDDTYERQKQDFKNKKDKLIKELKKAEDKLRELKKHNGILNNIFLHLKELQECYDIPNIYSVEEEREFKNLPKFVNLSEFIKEIGDIEPFDKKTLDKDKYCNILDEIKQLNNYIANLNEFINQKNKIIQKFKDDNTDQNINIRIDESKKEKEQLENENEFLKSGKIKNQKLKDEKTDELNNMKEELKNREEKYKNKKREYNEYCSGEIFNNHLEKLKEYLSKFNLNFKLEMDVHRRRHTEVPYTFKIVDNSGYERTFKEGLSEGELQVLSLSFFFAFLDIQTEKDKKILVFDDPITSLSNNNLYVLVDLISEKAMKFSQTFIFTHHQTFFKYLNKKYGRNNNAKSYYILKNKESLGGSFICLYQKQDLINKLKNMGESTRYKSKHGLDLTYETIRYGQFLRYEVERLVKNKLLQWDEKPFSEIIDGIKYNKKIDDDDLYSLKKIYSFCNWSNTAHVDKDEGTSFEQLKKHVNDFIEIYDKYHQGR